MAESVRVICRCRPFNQRETKLGSQSCVDMDPSLGQCVLQSVDGPPKLFTFDGVYFMDSTSEQIYNDIVYPLVDSVVEGYNGTVFAYGQTGSGKTFSMQGEDKSTVHRGIIPRSFEQIFESVATIAQTKFLVHVSYLEIYNEEIRDLLGEPKQQQKLEIKENGDRGIYVAGLSMHVCHDVKDCLRLMDTGFNNRHVGATLMNKDSSRSHSIFTIYVEALSENSGSIRMGKLNLVDLAGSERQAKTGATGERFKEATKINLSLSALGNVISALVDGKSTHIPYRDSKLTRLLQDSLGGNTKTVMVACISPSDNNYDETLSTLRYANRAKNIKNQPRINEDPKDALLREYQQEIERLKNMVKNPGAAQAASSTPNPEELEAIKEKLRAEFAQSMSELRASYESEQKSKAKLEEDLAKLRQQYEKAAADVEVARKSGEPLDESEARKRLQQLQQQLVGGEQANNEALKQKRLKKMREAEKKMQKLAEALNVHKDDPLLHVYSSTQDKLDAVTKQYNREVEKVRALESEIHDIQGEFELDRLDYLETIRKQDQQLKLLHQILERVHPIIRKDSNYADLARIKREAIWNEDQGKWMLPEVFVAKAGLPNAASGVMPGANTQQNGNHAILDEDLDTDSRLKKRLEQSMENDFVNSYFKPTSKTSIVNKYTVDRHHKNLAHASCEIYNIIIRAHLITRVTLDPVYTFEEFLNCDEDAEEAEIREAYNRRIAAFNSRSQRFSDSFYNNVALDISDEDQSNANPTSSTKNCATKSNGTQNQERPSLNPVGHRSRHSINSVSSLGEITQTTLAHAPQILCASSLAAEQVGNKQPDRLHPILRRPFKLYLCEIFCCRKKTSKEPESLNQHQPGMFSKCFKCSCFKSPANTRADQYRMADMTEQPAIKTQQGFSWEVERPSPLNYRFSNVEDAVLVKRRGDINGQQFVIENCQNSVLLVLDNLGAVTVDDCKSCVIVLGPCSGSVFVRDCTDCSIYTVCQQFRSRDCSIMVHLFCATAPIVEETTAQFFPLFLRYPFIEENMSQSKLSPFTNTWHKVHNFTPDSAQFTVSEEIKPIGQTYGPVHNWLPDLKQERVSIDPMESFFVKIPITKKIENNEERVLILFNLLEKSSSDKDQPSLSSFYSTTMSIVQRLCADPKVARLLISHDLNIKTGELANVLGKKVQIHGKLVTIELAGPINQCRQFVDSILKPVNYPGIHIQVIDADNTNRYKKNLDRLADVQVDV